MVPGTSEICLPSYSTEQFTAAQIPLKKKHSLHNQSRQLSPQVAKGSPYRLKCITTKHKTGETLIHSLSETIEFSLKALEFLNHPRALEMYTNNKHEIQACGGNTPQNTVKL